MTKNRIRHCLVLLAMTGLAAGCTSGGSATTPPPDPGALRLVAYDSCQTALDQLRDSARQLVGPYGFGRGGRAFTTGDRQVEPKEAPAAGEVAGATGKAARHGDHSGTNNQVAGVAEPDLVKTDGERVVTLAGGELRVIDVASREITATVRLPGSGRATDLFLDGDRVLVLGSTPRATVHGRTPAVPQPSQGSVITPRPPVPPRSRPGATLTQVDISGKARVLGTLELEGSYVDARAVAGQARIVLRSTPRLGFVRPHGALDRAEAARENRSILEHSAIEDWLPGYRLETGGAVRSGTLVDCARVSHPGSYSGTSMLTLLTVDLRGELGRGDPVSIVADGDTVYGTASSVYVADDHRALAGKRTDTRRTRIHKFDISQAGPPRYVASGAVDGRLLNQYALSEYRGHLRVATTSGSGSESESSVTVLARQGGDLVPVGAVTGLGKGERIYAVRFMGPVGYVVTFRKTDPLYTLELSDPAHPRAVGELKITGYSAYLHSVGDGKLIGVGQEATSEGRRTGVAVSLFDVDDPAAPTRLAQYTLDGGRSEVAADPHAFLYRERAGLIVVPVSGGGDPGALVLRLAGDKLVRVGTVRHEDGSRASARIRRSLIIGDELWTVSAAGAQVNDPASLEARAWIAFT